MPVTGPSWNPSWPPTETHYDSVLLLLADQPSWVTRILHRGAEDRLRRSLNVRVDALGRSGLTPEV